MGSQGGLNPPPPFFVSLNVQSFHSSISFLYSYVVGCNGTVTTLTGTPPATSSIDPCLVYTTSSALTTRPDTGSTSITLNSNIRDTIQPTSSSVHSQTSTLLTPSTSYITSQIQPYSSTHVSSYIQSDRTVSSSVLGNRVQTISTEVEGEFRSTVTVRASSFIRSKTRVLINTGK